MNARELIEIAYKNSADGIVVIDQDRTVRAFNPAMARMFGWDEQTVIGTKCFEVLKLQDDRSQNVCESRCPLVSHTDGECNFQGAIASRNGTSLEVGITYSSVTLQDGSTLLVASICELSKLSEIEELRTSLLASVSHELQTPIAIIKAYASTLARADVKWDRETIKAKLKTIEEESDRLSTIVTKLLFTSRLEAGIVKLNRMTLDLSKEARRIAKRLAGTTDIHTISVDFPEKFPPVYADPEKIEEVFINLIENAIKFSPDGGTIMILGNTSWTDVMVSVADSGIGIQAEDGEKLFERFYRADEGSFTSAPGTGLGLYICRSLIEAHGGKISVEGTIGQGACFTFTLPKHETQKVRDHHDSRTQTAANNYFSSG